MRRRRAAVHAIDVMYVFGTFGQLLTNRVDGRARFDADDREVGNAMQHYWTNFVKSGDPNDEMLPRWRPFEPESRAYLDFDRPVPTPGEGLRRAYCDVYVEHIAQGLTH